MRRFVERAVAYWAMVGVEYATLRWVIHTGHLAFTFAWSMSSIYLAITRIEKKVGSS